MKFIASPFARFGFLAIITITISGCTTLGYTRLAEDISIGDDDLACCQTGASCRLNWSQGETCGYCGDTYHRAKQYDEATEYYLRQYRLGSARSLDAIKMLGELRRDGKWHLILDLSKGLNSVCLGGTIESHAGTNETGRFCSELAEQYDQLSYKDDALKTRTKACDDYGVPGDCEKLGKYHGQVLTNKVLSGLYDRKESDEGYRKEKILERRLDDRENRQEQERFDREAAAADKKYMDDARERIDYNLGEGNQTQRTLGANINGMNAAIRARQGHGSSLPPSRSNDQAPSRPSASNRAPVAINPPSSRTEPDLQAPNYELNSWAADRPNRNNLPFDNTNDRENLDKGLGPVADPGRLSATTVKPSTEDRKDDFEYQSGGEFDNCIEIFYDPAMYNWYTVKNNCNVALNGVLENGGGAGGGAGDMRVGGKWCTGETKAEAARYPNRTLAFCRLGMIPVGADNKYWRTGPYRCRGKLR